MIVFFINYVFSLKLILDTEFKERDVISPKQGKNLFIIDHNYKLSLATF